MARNPASELAGPDLSSPTVSGELEHVIWSDAASGAIIARIRGGVTVKGNTNGSPLATGRKYVFFGQWTTSEQYGAQFRFESFTEGEPDNKQGIVKYLVEKCHGIGNAGASRLYEEFGNRTLAAIWENPTGAANACGISEAVAKAAAKEIGGNLQAAQSRAECFALLAGKGFGPSAVDACLAKWGARAAQLIRRDPWLLLTNDIPRAGFKTVDRLFLTLGGDPGRLKRQTLAGWDSLREASSGDTWHGQGVFNAGIVKAVNVVDSRCDRALELAVRAGWVQRWNVAGESMYLAEHLKAANERLVAQHLRRLLEGGNGEWTDLDGTGVSEHQAELWERATDWPVVIIAGTPGTGKTYLAAAAIKRSAPHCGHNRIAVCAPTGKAAVRITEALHRSGVGIQATTIHQLLRIGRNGYDGRGWGFLHDENDPLPYDLVVVDEVSMLDVDLAASLFRAIPDGARLLLVGDPYQLPPVGHGATLRDCLAAGLPTCELTEIHRNSGAIVRACRDIKEGVPFKACESINEAIGDNLRLIECKDEREQLVYLRAIFDRLKAAGSFDPFRDVQVITPMNDKSQVSRKQLNAMLQAIVNPASSAGEAEKVGDFRRKDKIICLRNTFLSAVKDVPATMAHNVAAYSPAPGPSGERGEHYIANGDSGQVLALDEKTKTIVVRFDAPTRLVKIPMGRPAGDANGGEDSLGERFALSYAITIHKSQGSEWPLVIVMVDEEAKQIASRELIYTAISRAKRVCLILGKRAVIDKQLRIVSLGKRKTFLKELLTHG